MREKQGNKTTETQDDISSPTHRYTPPLPLLTATQQDTKNLIGQTHPQESHQISYRNRIMPTKGEGSYESGVTQDFIAAGTTHVQLTSKRCEAKWELLTVFGMTQSFAMKKQRSLWST